MIFLQLFCKSKITFKKPKVEKLHFTPPALPTHAPGVNHCELSVCLYTLFLSVYKYVYTVLFFPPLSKIRSIVTHSSCNLLFSHNPSRTSLSVDKDTCCLLFISRMCFHYTTVQGYLKTIYTQHMQQRLLFG